VWSEATTQRFDGVLTNPPFHQGMATAHVTAAALLVKPTGHLVAIMPDSWQIDETKEALQEMGFTVSIGDRVEDAFEGANVTVRVVSASRLR